MEGLVEEASCAGGKNVSEGEDSGGGVSVRGKGWESGWSEGRTGQ